jgi:hypothetical protein
MIGFDQVHSEAAGVVLMPSASLSDFSLLIHSSTFHLFYAEDFGSVRLSVPEDKHERFASARSDTFCRLGFQECDQGRSGSKHVRFCLCFVTIMSALSRFSLSAVSRHRSA